MNELKGYPTVHRPLFQLTDEQERKLIQAAKKKDNPELFLLMISTGIQWQELAAVRRISLLKRAGALELTHRLLRDKGLMELPSKSVRMRVSSGEWVLYVDCMAFFFDLVPGETQYFGCSCACNEFELKKRILDDR